MKLSGLNIFDNTRNNFKLNLVLIVALVLKSKALYSFVFSDATEDDGSQVGHPGHHVTTQRLRGHVSAGNATHSLFLVPGFTSATVIVSQCLSPAHAQYLPHQLGLLY